MSLFIAATLDVANYSYLLHHLYTHRKMCLIVRQYLYGTIPKVLSNAIDILQPVLPFASMSRAFAALFVHNKPM